jgi:hypothetical protein
MAVITEPIALDKSFRTEDGNNTGIAEVLRRGFASISNMKSVSQTVASSGWTAESYTSTSGTVYAYKKEIAIAGMTADTYVDIALTSGTYTGAFAVESASGKVVIRTATQPSASLTFRVYYQLG